MKTTRKKSESGIHNILMVFSESRPDFVLTLSVPRSTNVENAANEVEAKLLRLIHNNLMIKPIKN